MRNERIRGSLRPHLVSGAAESQDRCLSKSIRGQHVLHVKNRLQRLSKKDEVTGHDLGPLMEQLVKGMLTIRPGLTPVDRTGVVVDSSAVQSHRLAVALHRQLLQVRRKA